MKHYKQKKRLNNSTRNRRRKQRLVKECFNQALKRIEKALGPQPPRGAFTRSAMDAVYQALGKEQVPKQMDMTPQEWDDLVNCL